MLVPRVLSAVVGLPLLVAVVAWGPAWLFTALVLVMALGAQLELYRMFGGLGIEADRVAGLVMGALVLLAFCAPSPVFLPFALSCAVLGALTLGVARGAGSERAWAGVALTLLGVCYCAWLPGHAVWLRARPDGRALVLFGLGVTWCGESAAYFVGRRLGRHRLAPALSPGKTVEGAVAQVLVSVAVAAWVGPLVPLPRVSAALVGLLLGLVGQIGDLAESFLKRSAGVKDAGHVIPGHGGLLDRLDSLLFNLPALYYWLSFAATVR